MASKRTPGPAILSPAQPPTRRSCWLPPTRPASRWPSRSCSRSGKHPPSTTIETQARVYLRNVSGIPTIQRIDLDTEADVPGIDEAELRQWAEEARTGCIISRALSGVEEITLSARLR
jgi:hypothetical protein